MNRRKLLQSILGTTAAAALLKTSSAPAKDIEVDAESGLLMPAQTIPPCVFELRQATDGVLLYSAPLDPNWVVVTEPGDKLVITLNIEMT